MKGDLVLKDLRRLEIRVTVSRVFRFRLFVLRNVLRLAAWISKAAIIVEEDRPR